MVESEIVPKLVCNDLCHVRVSSLRVGFHLDLKLNWLFLVGHASAGYSGLNRTLPVGHIDNLDPPVRAVLY